MTNIEMKNDVNTYDEVPYESYPYSQSSVYSLMTLGVLFGIDVAPPTKCRVLELGCASGGNIIPHAVSFPTSEFVGVDLSSVQINEAKKHKATLSLNNIEFHNCSIMDIDKSFGKFDYIICHGVISWVPEFVREKIFEVCSKNLNKNGIAYISYNTLPGWNMIRTIRDMMVYHSKTFPNVKDKIAQSRLLLEFVKDSLEGANSPYAEVLRAEAALLSKQSDHYIRHDHLEEENYQYYFADFMKEATKHDLQYLADTSLSTMYIGNMPPKVAEQLKTINDIVRTEQYMDFINNRRFRSSLLCHKNITLNRNINISDVTKFNMLFNITPEKPLSEVNLDDALETLNFFFNNNTESKVSSSSPCMKAIMYTFAEHVSNPVSFDKIAASANKKLGGNKLHEVKNEFLNNAMNLVLRGYITITLQEERKPANQSKPKTSKLALHQVVNTNNLWVTNLKHEVVGINIFEKYALRYMNGKHSKDDLVGLILKHVESNELTMNKDGKPITETDAIRKELSSILDTTIPRLAALAILE